MTTPHARGFGGSTGDSPDSSAARDRDAGSSTIELPGPDGTVTTLVQYADGSIEIRTSAMTADGHSVRVAPTGVAHAC